MVHGLSLSLFVSASRAAGESNSPGDPDAPELHVAHAAAPELLAPGLAAWLHVGRWNVT